MEYRIFNADGKHIAGDAVLDEVVKAGALIVDGWVEDQDGNTVYTSPGRRVALEEQAKAEAEAAAAEERDDEPESLTGVVTPPEEERHDDGAA